MSAPISEDPNKNTARASKTETVLTYPVHEQLSAYTRLRFVEYSRFNPSDSPTDKTTSVITMPMPLSIPDAASVRTASENLNVFGMVNADSLSKVAGTSQSISDMGISETTKLGYSIISDSLKRQIGDFNASTLRGLALSPIMPDSIRTPAKAFAGVIQNPHTTMIFEGVNLKSLNLEWRVSPRSQQESDTLDRIIKTIKMRIHPEEYAGGYALDYPDLVYVEFGGRVDKYLPKFQKAFVNSFVATPDTGSSLAFYKSGAPIAYNIQLSITELSIVTRNTLREQNGEN